jgi:hypothetical protein
VPNAAEISVIARDTSVAVSMARSAAPGWNVDLDASTVTVRARSLFE